MWVSLQSHTKEDILSVLFVPRDIFDTDAESQSVHVFLTKMRYLIWLCFVLFFMAGFPQLSPHYQHRKEEHFCKAPQMY